MSEPLVSVLLPVRDEEPFLVEALASLSAQTLEDFEVVVVDDGSRDASADIATEHARGDRRFRVLRQEAQGLVAALERARVDCRGRFLARMDGDDVALPRRLALQVEALESEGLDAAGGGISYLGHVRDGARRYERWINSLVSVEAAARDVFVECPLPHPTLVARRELVSYRDCGWPEDYDLVLRLWASGARFRNVDEVVLRWREHPGRASHSDGAYSVDSFVRCKAHHLRATLARGEFVVWGAGPVGKAFARELRRLGSEVVAFVEVDPRKLGREIYGIPVVSIDEAPRFAGAFAIGAVAGEEARTQIREVVAKQGRRDGVDFVAVA